MVGRAIETCFSLNLRNQPGLLQIGKSVCDVCATLVWTREAVSIAICAAVPASESTLANFSCFSSQS